MRRHPSASRVPPRSDARVGVQAGTPIGDFHIIREIGRGGMGIIYEATQLSLGRRVALKVLPFAAGLDNKFLQRFRLESQAAAQLHHNNIVPVFGVGCDRGVHFYAMQLIDGVSLDRVIRLLATRGRGPFPGVGVDGTTDRTGLERPRVAHARRRHPDWIGRVDDRRRSG